MEAYKLLTYILCMYLSNVTTSKGNTYSYSNTQETSIKKKLINTKIDEKKDIDTKGCRGAGHLDAYK